MIFACSTILANVRNMNLWAYATSEVHSVDSSTMTESSSVATMASGSLSVVSVTSTHLSALSGDSSLILAFLLMILAVALVLIEVFVVSFGVLMMSAAVIGVISLILAAQHGVTPALMIGLLGSIGVWGAIVYGFRILRRSSLISGSTVEATSGYLHAVNTAQVTVGSKGILLTAARPSGRARFPDGYEIDVICDRSADPGTGIQVVSMDGMGCFVQVLH